MRRGRPKADCPTPSKRKRSKAWSIFWKADGRFYQCSAGPVTETRAEAARLRVAIALRTNDPDDGAKCPQVIQEPDAVRRYLKRNLRADEGDILTAYESHIVPVLEADWAKASMIHIRELARSVGKPLCDVTAQDADMFLTHVMTSPGPRRKKGQRSRATRNRKLVQ